MTNAGFWFHPSSDPGEHPTALLPVGSNPTVVANWAAGLTQAQKEYLIDHGYDTLGQLKGLPAPVLDTSNRLSDHGYDTLQDLWHLDPGKAAGDYWNGTWHEGKNVVHDVRDVAGVAASGAKWVWGHP